MMKNIKILLSALLLTLSFPALAEVSVIVHPDNSNLLDNNDVRKIFLGKTKTFPDGNKVRPYDLDDNDPTKEEFAKKGLRKSMSSLNSYWSRMLFSSKGKPPTSLNDAKAMKKAVASNIAAIGYIDSNDVDASVKVITTLP